MKAPNPSEPIDLDFTGVFRLADLKLPPPTPPVPKEVPKELIIGVGRLPPSAIPNCGRSRTFQYMADVTGGNRPLPAGGNVAPIAVIQTGPFSIAAIQSETQTILA